LDCRGHADTSFPDPTQVGDDGVYFLVRGVNACGPAATQGWGDDSLERPRPAYP